MVEVLICFCFFFCLFFFFKAEDGIRDLVRSRGLGDVYKRQASGVSCGAITGLMAITQKRLVRKYYVSPPCVARIDDPLAKYYTICLLYTSDAADERSSVDLGGRRIIKKTKKTRQPRRTHSRTDDRKE